jgi:hypothetical protein
LTAITRGQKEETSSTSVSTSISIHLKESTSYRNFVNAIRSPSTKTVYTNSLKRYMNYIKVKELDSLLETNSAKIIESQLIDYIMSLRQDGISYSTIKYLLAPIFTFYQLNDVTLKQEEGFPIGRK